MIQLWAAGCFGCQAFSQITRKRDDAREWRSNHERIAVLHPKPTCKRKARIYRVVLAATR